MILPLLLLIIFTIIELARVLFAWMSVENGARFGVRFGVTGEYNVAYCVDGADPGTGACAGTGRIVEEEAARQP